MGRKLGRQIAGATFLFPDLRRKEQPILAAFAADFGNGGLAVDNIQKLTHADRH